MPAKDLYHEVVKTALIKDCWQITHDPLILRLGLRSVYVDIGAERLIAARRGLEKIAVEIKSFSSPSPIHDLENAWGEFFLYARVLQRRDPNRILYLAISRTTFDTLFNEEAGQIMQEEPGFRLIVFNPKTEDITQWIL